MHTYKCLSFTVETFTVAYSVNQRNFILKGKSDNSNSKTVFTRQKNIVQCEDWLNSVQFVIDIMNQSQKQHLHIQQDHCR